jgi:hypothetical protein
MHLVAMPNPVMLFKAVNDNGSSFTQRLFPLGGFSLTYN